MRRKSAPVRHPPRATRESNTSSLPTMTPLWVCAASLPAGLRPALSTTTGFHWPQSAGRSAKRRALEMPSRYTTMLCVCGSAARKSNTWRCQSLCSGPPTPRRKKPTALLRAQSRMDAVNAPDCDTSAKEPARSQRPRHTGVELQGRSLQAHAVGTQQKHALVLGNFAQLRSQVGANAAGNHHHGTAPMRPATSSAVRMSSWGSAMMARSARPAPNRPACQTCGYPETPVAR